MYLSLFSLGIRESSLGLVIITRRWQDCVVVNRGRWWLARLVSSHGTGSYRTSACWVNCWVYSCVYSSVSSTDSVSPTCAGSLPISSGQLRKCLQGSTHRFLPRSLFWILVKRHVRIWTATSFIEACILDFILFHFKLVCTNLHTIMNSVIEN